MAKREHASKPKHHEHHDVVEAEPTESINWTASEFIAHQKSASWYLSLGLISVLTAMIIYFLTKDKVSTAAVIIAGIFLGSYGHRQPRQLAYELNAHGLSVGIKNYSYQAFRSFSLVQEGPFASIIFWPLRRFATPISIYFDPADGEKILNLLTPRLPEEPPHSDPIDSLMRRIRF